MKMFRVGFVLLALLYFSELAMAVQTYCPAKTDIKVTQTPEGLSSYTANIGGVYYYGEGPNVVGDFPFPFLFAELQKSNFSVLNEEHHMMVNINCYYKGGNNNYVVLSAGTFHQKLTVAKFAFKSAVKTVPKANNTLGCISHNQPSQCLIDVTVSAKQAQ